MKTKLPTYPNIREMFLSTVRGHHDRLFLENVDKTGKKNQWTYGEAKEKVLSTAKALIHLGLNKGDRIAILSENYSE